MKNGYNQTIYASYIGYITQALVNNFSPLLFITFNKTLGISMELIALLITINFGTQLLVDWVSSRYVNKVGTRFAVVSAHFFAAAGVFSMAFLPSAFGFCGLAVSTMLYAVGGGLIEVIISPIVEACPTEKKAAVMSVLHSFYCWGQLATILVSTLFFSVFGMENWKTLAMLWAIIPFINAFWFMLVPINTEDVEQPSSSKKQLFKSGLFWILLLLMLCSGASELGMSQWASAFAEDALGISKTIGDLAGPCMFAFLMGISRILHAKLTDRISIESFMVCSGILAVASYLTASVFNIPAINLIGCAICGFSVGVMWPGTYSLAASKIPTGGVAMFSTLALAGDLGCSVGPGMIGIFSSYGGLKTGVLVGAIFPALMILGIFLLKRQTRKSV